MAKIVLTDQTATYDNVSINEQFTKLEDEFQNKVLYRNNPTGEPNTMENSLDMNGKRILNLAAPASPNEAARLQDVQNAIAGQATASLTAFTPSGTISATTVQAAIEEVAAEASSGPPTAAGVTFTPFGTISSTNVQAAIQEVVTEFSAGVPDSSVVPYLPPGTGAVSTFVAPKLKEISSLNDFGGVEDGVTNSTAPAGLAITYGGPILTKKGTYQISTDPAVTGVNFWGFGTLRTIATNNKHARFTSSVVAAPSTEGNQDSILTAFNGDWSKNFFNIEHWITGAATLGNPVTGYRYVNEASPFYMYLYNSSGHNQSASSNDGRTAAVAMRVKVDQYGQGDCMAYNAVANVISTRAGSTDVLANPAASILAGDCYSFIAGGYCNPIEINLGDSGTDSAGAGAVFNLNRSVSTAAKKAFWSGVRVQSVGSANIDSSYYASGPMKVGLNLAAATISPSTLAAITFKANNRIYFNSTDPGTTYDSVTYGLEYMSYSSATSTLSIAVNDTPMVQVKSTQVLVRGTTGFFVTPDGTTTKFFVDGTNTRASNFFICVPGGGADSAASITANTTALYLGNQAQGIGVELNGTVKYTGTGIAATTVGAAGGASALPATPVTYLIVNINNTLYKIPVYNT